MRAPAAGPPTGLARYRPIAFLAATTLYLLAFFTAELSELSARTGTVWRRVDFLQLILLPDALVEGWFGANGAWQLADRVPILLMAFTIWLVAALAGWLVLRASRVSAQLDGLEQLVYSAGVGASLVSLYVLVVGLAGGLHRPALLIVPGGLVVLAAGVVAVRTRRGHAARTESAARTSRDRSAEWPGVRWLWWGLPFVVAIVLGGMLPPIDFDVREYHLQAPKEYFLSGQISFLPHNVYASMPLGSEMLSLLAMVVTGDWWLGGLVGKTAISMFTPLTALAILGAGRRWFSCGAGIFAALVYLSIPWIALVSTTGLIEGASAFYWFLAVNTMLRWRVSRTTETSPRVSYQFVFLAGFLAGSAVAVKYPAALFVIVPLAIWIVYLERQLATRPLLLFLIAATLACGPWLAKNWVQTGNPTYPLLQSVFRSDARSDAKNAQWHAAHDPPNFSPLDAAGRVADVALRSPWISPLVVPLVVAALLWRRRDWPVMALVGYLAFLFVAWWLFTHRIDRFWVPALPVAALLAGAGATWCAAPGWRRAISVLILCGLVANFIVITSGVCGDNSYLAPLAELRSHSMRIPPWIVYLNEHRPPDRAVLAVGDAAVFDLAPPVLYNTAFDENELERLVRPAFDARTAESLDVLHREMAEQVAFVYVNWAEIDRYRSEGNYGFTEFVEPGVFEFLVERGVLAPAVAGFDKLRIEIYPVRPYEGDAPSNESP